MSTVSKHLSILKNAGIVMDEKRGSSIYYALSVPCILDFLKCADALLQEISRAQVNGNNVAP
jgi:ArsR family transcriptional regulator